MIKNKNFTESYANGEDKAEDNIVDGRHQYSHRFHAASRARASFGICWYCFDCSCCYSFLLLLYSPQGRLTESLCFRQLVAAPFRLKERKRRRCTLRLRSLYTCPSSGLEDTHCGCLTTLTVHCRRCSCYRGRTLVRDTREDWRRRIR